jgi:hypothetical protein
MQAGVPDGLLNRYQMMAWDRLLHTSTFFSKKQIPEDKLFFIVTAVRASNVTVLFVHKQMSTKFQTVHKTSTYTAHTKYKKKSAVFS